MSNIGEIKDTLLGVRQSVDEAPFTSVKGIFARSNVAPAVAAKLCEVALLLEPLKEPFSQAADEAYEIQEIGTTARDQLDTTASLQDRKPPESIANARQASSIMAETSEQAGDSFGDLAEHIQSALGYLAQAAEEITHYNRIRGTIEDKLQASTEGQRQTITNIDTYLSGLA